MPDFILVDGDAVTFDPRFTAGQTVLVVVKPGRIKGTGVEKVNGVRMCVKGDERSVEIAGCQYMSDHFAKPGVGTLTIKELGPGQKSGTRKSGNLPVLLKGGQFPALFTVTAPAMTAGAVLGAHQPDKTGVYFGRGFFITKNNTEKAS